MIEVKPDFLPDVAGWLTREEGEFLTRIAEGKAVLEIGSYCGRSTICLAQSADLVVAVDPFTGETTPCPRDTFNEYMDNLRRYGVHAKVTTYIGRSDKVIADLNRQFDLIFIDGAHEYKLVRTDIGLAKSVLKPGGLLVFHDYRMPGEPDDIVNPDVRVAVDELRHGNWKLIKRAGSVAVLQEVVAEVRPVLPQKLSCVIVCVGYADYLKKTLGHNARMVDELVVVTHPDDAETITAFRECQEKQCPPIWLVCSDCCYDDQCAFNHGKMINYGLMYLKDPEWVLITDADCFLPAGLNHYVKTHFLDKDTLYGAPRVDFDSQEEDAATRTQPNGYFQLFHHQAMPIADLWPKVRSENFCSAAGHDSQFLQRFKKHQMINELPVRHLRHGFNWNGMVPRKGWNQCGFLTTRGWEMATVDYHARKLKLTDTLRGETVEIDYPGSGIWPRDILLQDDQGLVFLGKPIGKNHIHVAYFQE